MKKPLIILSGLICLIYSSIAYAQESFKVYPVQGIFLSDRATENHLFKKALSSETSVVIYPMLSINLTTILRQTSRMSLIC